MNKIKIILLILITYSFCLAYDWSPIGPDTVKVNDYLSSFLFGDILCVSDGILINNLQETGWDKYTNAKMPAIQAVDYDSSGIMVILSDSSWSDGIYKFNFQKKQFEVLKYASFPQFLFYYNLTDTYYCGYDNGLLKSEDGTNWEEVEYFKLKNCLTMYGSGNILLVSENDKIHYSYDQGKSWTSSDDSPAHVSAITQDWNETFFAIFPGTSRSSGLWSSVDSGKTWQVEFWSTHMSTVYFTYGELFVGWEQPDGDNEGVAVWNKSKEQLTLLNEGLLNTSVNRFTENTLVDCYNVVVCTDSGAYINCEFPMNLPETNLLPDLCILYQNYPNPFNPKTVINYTVRVQNIVPQHIELSIFNSLGQKVATLVSEKQAPGEYQVEWDACSYSSGVYFYQLSIEQGFSESKKMILLK